MTWDWATIAKIAEILTAIGYAAADDHALHRAHQPQAFLGDGVAALDRAAALSGLAHLPADRQPEAPSATAGRNSAPPPR